MHKKYNILRQNMREVVDFELAHWHAHETIPVMFDRLAASTQIKSVKISNYYHPNVFHNPENCEHFIRAITGKATITKIYLENIAIDDAQVPALAAALGSLSNLQQLYLGALDTHKPTLLWALQTCPQLQDLQLCLGGYTASDNATLCELSSSLQHLTQLRKLRIDVSSNWYSSDSDSDTLSYGPLYEAVCQLTLLEELILPPAETKRDCQILSAALSKLPALIKLTISYESDYY